jgi:hypothetical protein
MRFTYKQSKRIKIFAEALRKKKQIDYQKAICDRRVLILQKALSASDIPQKEIGKIRELVNQEFLRTIRA